MKIIKFFLVGTVSVALLVVGLLFTYFYFPVAQLYYLKMSSGSMLDSLVSNKVFPYKRNSVVGEYELGEISLSTGEKVKFWFLSHHNSLTSNSYTLFEFPNGEKKIMYGYFCCEVQFPSEVIANISSFNDFLKNNDGVKP